MADYKTINYPSAGTNPSVGTTNQPVPTSATLVAGSDGTNLQSVKVSSTGVVSVDGSAVTQPVSVASLPLPSGASTSANQTNGSQKTQIVNGSGTVVSVKDLGTQVVSTDNGLIVNAVIHGLTTGGGGGYVDMKVTPSGAVTTALGDISGVVGQNTMVNSLPVTIASNQSAVPVSGSVSVSNFPATQPVSGTVTANAGTGSFTVAQATAASLNATVVGTGTFAVQATQSGTWDINNVSGTVSLPTGAATSSLQTQISGQLPTTLGQKTSANSMAVVIASDQSGVKTVVTNSKGEFVRNDYTSTSVTTSAYTQLIASTSAAYSAIEIFDSSGQTLKLAIGGAGSEVDQFIIFPGGNGRIPYSIASGSRISIRALSATANSGEIDINLFV